MAHASVTLGGQTPGQTSQPRRTWSTTRRRRRQRRRRCSDFAHGGPNRPWFVPMRSWGSRASSRASGKSWGGRRRRQPRRRRRPEFGHRAFRRCSALGEVLVCSTCSRGCTECGGVLGLDGGRPKRRWRHDRRRRGLGLDGNKGWSSN